MTTADKLTVSRIILTPIIIGMMVLWNKDEGLWVAFILYLVASITDFLDGYIARKNNQQSEFGKLWDPLADKLLVCSVFIIFVAWGQIPAWGAVLIICREFLVTGLRSEAARKQRVIAADAFGKIKTISQILFQSLVFFKSAIIGNLHEPKETPFDMAIGAGFWIVMLLTSGSAIQFAIKNRQFLYNK